MRRRTYRLLHVIVGAAAIAGPNAAWAHRDDYIDETFVYQTLETHEFELELWGDARGGRGEPWIGVYTGAFEFGVSSGWMVDGAVQWRHDPGGLGLGRARAETRYRFAEEGAWPVDVAASAEYELERATAGDAEHVVTPRLVVSRDIVSDLNTTVNLDLPISVAPRREISFAYALGLRYPARGLVRGGVELKHQPSRGQAILFPQVWFALPAEITIKLGVGVGLAGTTPAITSRAVFEIEL